MGLVHHDRVKSIPLHRVAVVRPFAQQLEDIGAPVERGFRLAGLPYYTLENVDNFVPSQRFWSFLVNMAYSQGIEDLGFRVGRRFGANCADPHLTSLLHESLTMYQGLLKASDLTTGPSPTAAWESGSRHAAAILISITSQAVTLTTRPLSKSAGSA